MLFLGPFRFSQARSGAGHAVSVWDGPMWGVQVEGASLSLLLPAELGWGRWMALPGGPSQIQDGSTGHLRRGVLWRAGRLQLCGVFGKLVPWWGEAGRGRAVRVEVSSLLGLGDAWGQLLGGSPHTWPGFRPSLWSPYPAEPGRGPGGEAPPGTRSNDGEDLRGWGRKEKPETATPTTHVLLGLRQPLGKGPSLPRAVPRDHPLHLVIPGTQSTNPEDGALTISRMWKLRPI